jgi:hypothetical protein
MADPVSLAINAALIAANMALTASQEFEGPRLDDLKVTTADYGTPLNYVHGRRRLDGVSCIWAEPLREVKRRRKTKGGKFNEWTYYGTWAVALCDNQIDRVLKVWFDRNLVYDATGAGPTTPIDLNDYPEGPAGEAASELGLGDLTRFMTVYLGTDDQEPDPRMAATVDAEHGTGSTPAYRGVAYIVFKDVPLEKLGNRLPQVSVEVATASTDAFPLAEREATVSTSVVISFSPDGSRLYYADLVAGSPGPVQLDIWDCRAAALMSTVEIDDIASNNPIAVDSAGRIYMTESDQNGFVVLNPDGIGQIAQHAAAGIDAPVRVIDGALNERIVFTSWSTNSDGYTYSPTGVAPELIDTSVLTGFDWQIKFALADTHGDIWLLGGAGDLAGDELAVYRWVNVSGRAGPDFAVITMPVSNGGAITGVSAYAPNDDMIVVDWGLGTPLIAQIDIETLTIIDTLSSSTAGMGFAGAAATPPGTRTVWIGGREWDFVNLEVVRTIDASDWDPTYASNQTTYYDRASHAIVRVSGDENIAWLYLDRASGDGVTLRSIVEAICERSGLTVADDIDATDLTQIVAGYSWTQGAGKAILEPLIEAYDSEARPHDFKLEFLRRGDAVGASIPVADMGAGGDVRYKIPDFSETDLMLKVNLTFADVDRDQQANTAIGQRSGQVIDGRREASLDGSTLALDADTAREMATGYLRREWTRAQKYELALTRAYSALEPGDARTLILDDVTVTAKLRRLEFGANGVLTTEWERYAPNVHVGSTLTGAPADGLIPDEVPVFGYTRGLALDIPLVTDSDESSTPFVYLAAGPYGGTTWPGAIFYRSDDGADYDEELGAVASTDVAAIGYALSALPDALATVWDNASTVSVKMHAGELESSTKALVGNGANRALIGDEIIGFTTATLVAEGTYQLSGLIRGRRGTEWATGTHAAGDRFVLLDSLPKADMGASDVSADVYVRPTTAGGPNGFAQHLDPYTGAALKPYAPAHLVAAEVAGDIVLAWTRRARTGGAWRDLQDVPLGEGSEAYVVQILNGSDAVIRTISGLSSPTATYTAAQQATDGGAGVTARVMQVSATVGNGFAADVAI